MAIYPDMKKSLNLIMQKSINKNKSDNFAIISQELSKIILEMRDFAKKQNMTDIISKPCVLKPIITFENKRPVVVMMMNNHSHGSFILDSLKIDKPLSFLTGNGRGLLLGTKRFKDALAKIRKYCVNFDNLRGRIADYISWRDFTELVEETALFNSVIKGLEAKADEQPLSDAAEYLLSIVYQWKRLRNCIDDVY